MAQAMGKVLKFFKHPDINDLSKNVILQEALKIYVRPMKNWFWRIFVTTLLSEGTRENAKIW